MSEERFEIDVDSDLFSALSLSKNAEFVYRLRERKAGVKFLL